MHKFKLTFTWAIPGSGKSTWSQFQLKANPNNVYVYDLDSKSICYFTNKKLSKESIIDNLVCDITQRTMYGSKSINYIVDGLIYKNNQVKNILNKLNSNKNIKDKFDLEIVYWKPDVEKCLYNDKFRRVISSETTIKNIKVEVPDEKKIGMPFTLVTKEVIQKPYSQLKFDEFVFKINTNSKYSFVVSDNLLYGSSWCGGGTSGNCWDDELSSIGADAPEKFDDLTKLIDLICPDIKYLDCIKILNECCSVIEKNDSDYYGGRTTTFQHVCNLKTLFDELEKLKYINIT